MTDMEDLFSILRNELPTYKCFFQAEFLPYLNTAGSVLLGWIVVTWMWHVILIFIAPAAISIIAVILICPKTLRWLIRKFKPSAEESACLLMEKIGLSTDDIGFEYDA